ncbi:MAG: hypothetical protein U0414_14760 [Polyangiaceae bacterium]
MQAKKRPAIYGALFAAAFAGVAAASSCATTPDEFGGAVGATASSGSKGSSSSTKASSTTNASSTNAASTSADASSSTDAASSSTDAASSSVSASSASSTAASTTAGSTTGATTSSSSSTGGGTTCTEITAGNFWGVIADPAGGALYRALSAPNYDGATADILNVEFYAGGTFNGQNTGTFDLSMGGDDNYETCSRCVRGISDVVSGTSKQFFQQSGTMTIPAGSMHLNGTINATLTDVTLIEVTIDPNTFVSTPVPNGACLHIASANVAATVPAAAPAAWTCNDAFFLDGQDCDCGCGVFDPDCVTPEAGACGFCDDTGSCSATACPGTINASNNAICP